ncbi:RNA dependent RNA polymerase [uncultured Clostridium sp.]|nr:RNA dependent RNA polymerase [uncultured Clostridium sp.]
MEIRRITKQAVKLNKDLERKYNFMSNENLIGRCIDTIELDESLFTHYYAKWSGATGEVFATEDFIKVEFEHDIDIIERKIILDGIDYVFYLASASDLKKSSAIFIKESLVDTLGSELIKNATGDIVSRLQGMDVVINKIQAYISFMFSGAIKTNIEPKIVVIEEPQYKYTGLHTVLKSVDTLEFKEEVIETNLIAFDGQGIMSLELAERIRKELNSNREDKKQLEHINWITFRLFTIGGKGMCVAVNIKEQLQKVWMQFGDSEGLKMFNERLYVKDIYGQWHDVHSIDMILNQSQTKLIKYFKSNEDIEDAKNQVADDFKSIVNSLYVCKHNENTLRTDSTRMNYQFLQALSMTPNDISELTKSDKGMLEQALTDIDSMLIVNNLVEIREENDNEETVSNSFNLALDLVKYDETFLKDKTVLEQIRRLYMSKIKKLSYGRVFINDMAYRLCVQDPQPYMNFIATRDMETARNSDCLQAGEYSVVGRPENQKVVMGRNPLSSHQEMIRFNNKRNAYIDSLGYKCDSMIIFNSYDATPSRMSGMDFDGDVAGVIVDDIIYNSVIELDTPIFFNTFDGDKVENKYSKENIIEITKMTAGDKIGSLALGNAGLMNRVNEVPYYDTRTNEVLYLDDIYAKEQEEILKTWDMEGNINNSVWESINKLESDGTIINGIFSMDDKQMKDYLKERHSKFRYEQFLVLYAQQCAIDASKTGVDVPENIKQEIKKISERPYFICFTGDNRRYDKYRNSVLDVYARYTFNEFNQKRIHLLDEIDIALGLDVTKDKSFKNTNVVRDLFKRASVHANEEKVKALLYYIKPRFDEYGRNRQELRHYKDNKDYYYTAHEKYSREMRVFLKEYYDNCKENVNGFTLEDLTRAIYILDKPSKYILEFIPELLIYNVAKLNDRRKTFEVGNTNCDGKVITLGNKVYTVVYRNIALGELERNVQPHSLQIMKRRQLAIGSLLEMKSSYGVDFELDREYTLIRKVDNRHLFKVVDSNGMILDNVRLSQGSSEFKEDINELKVVIESYKSVSKTKKYMSWYVKRSI